MNLSNPASGLTLVTLIREDICGFGGLVHAILSPGFWAVLGYRIAHSLSRNHLDLPARAIQVFTQVFIHCEISRKASIGPQMRIFHPSGVFIGPYCRIGRLSTFGPGSFLGANTEWEDPADYPTLGDKVMVGPGAMIIGPVSIGSESWIGPNAVVMQDVPAKASVVAAPCRIIRRDLWMSQKALTLLLILVSGLACDGLPAARKADPSMNDTVVRELAVVRSSRIFLGHQSVGDNILRGVRLIARDAGVPPPLITRLEDGTVPAGPNWFESPVGENARPDTKLRDFERSLERLASAPVDVALLKFCYLDIDASTDVQRLFAQYRNVVAKVRIKYPSTALVPVTTPLKADDGLKGIAKRWLRGVDPIVENVRRNQYNDLLRIHFRAETIFDLARVESTRLDGRRETFGIGGEQYERLASDLTVDGGHLNDAGSRATGRELIRVLSEVLATRKHERAGLSHSSERHLGS